MRWFFAVWQNREVAAALGLSLRARALATELAVGIGTNAARTHPR